MTFEREQWLASGSVPKCNAAIVLAAHCKGLIDSDGQDNGRSLTGEEQLARSQVPYENGSIAAAADNSFVGRIDSNSVHPVRMANALLYQCASF